MKNLPIDACYMLFKKIDKPNNFEMCKAINVYDNKYRINVYTKNHDPIYDLDRVRITESYFCRITNNELTMTFQNKFALPTASSIKFYLCFFLL